MTFQLPTYEQALEVVAQNPAFKDRQEIFEGIKVHHFGYRLADSSDFQITPYHKELRGLVFIEQPDGSMKPYPQLHKFHNMNECDGYMEEDLVNNYELLSMQTKEDGSVINFIPINGKWYAKSKSSFHTEQAKLAQELLDGNHALQEDLDRLYELNYIPIFELVGSKNPIVLKYEGIEAELRLLQMRHIKTGEYVVPEIHLSSSIPLITKEAEDNPTAKRIFETFKRRTGIKVAGYHNYSFDGESEPPFSVLSELLKEIKRYQTILENIEGWILQLRHKETDEIKFVKFKTAWYTRLHWLLTELHEHNVIEMVVNEEVDDFLAEVKTQLIKGDWRVEMIERIQKLIIGHLKRHYTFIESTLKWTEDFTDKEMAERYHNYPYFSALMRGRRGHDIEENVKSILLKSTRRKEMAIEILDTIEQEDY